MTNNQPINLRQVLFIFFFSFNLFLGYSYNKPNHRIITKLAIDYLNEHYPGYISDKEARKIIRGNISEDGWNLKAIIRWWNQHFYAPQKTKNWSRPKSIDVRFNRIAQRCFDRVNSRRYFHYVGEIVHHIQDVTNPSHVIPVFHFTNPKDRFDHQPNLGSLVIKPSINTQVKYQAPFKLAILSPTAQQTLKNLDSKFDVTITKDGKSVKKQIDWSYFWKENPNAWFGCYGSIGAPLKGEHHDYYGRTIIVKGATHYEIEKSVYDEFSTQQLQLAVAKTAEFIYHAKQRYNQHIAGK